MKPKRRFYLNWTDWKLSGSYTIRWASEDEALIRIDPKPTRRFSFFTCGEEDLQDLIKVIFKAKEFFDARKDMIW